MLNICTKFRENISKGFRIIERTQFVFVKNEGGVTVLNLVHRLMKISHWISNLLGGHDFFTKMFKGA